MKLKVQAQHLQPGDVVGSGETVAHIIRSSIHWPSSKVCVLLRGPNGKTADLRNTYWGKYTEINIEREEKE